MAPAPHCNTMKPTRLFLLALLLGTLTASAQMPARRTMNSRKSQTETVKPDKETNVPTARERNAEQNTDEEKPASKPAITPAKTANRTAARPQARRTANSAADAAAKSFTREFPTAANVPDDAAWRRDIYRSIDLTKEENAVLYYPVVPANGRQNLFVYLFRQILRGNIKAYEYTLDANEHFDEDHIVKGKKIMDTHKIYYENNDGKIRVNDADLPSEDVKLYFVKESVCYDQHTATFRTKVTAICPVMVSGMSEFGEEENQRIPLFWVNYEEAAPYLAKLSLMGSSINNASVISADDYFTMNRYKGDIYKTTNLQDRIIAQYAEDEAGQAKERERIENELKRFEDQVWGHAQDSVRNAFGQLVMDGAGEVITRNAEGQLIDGEGRRIAFAVADSVAVASPDNLKSEARVVPVLVNERGFAVNDKGEPLLDQEGRPLQISYEYPTPEGVEGPNVKDDEKTSRKTTSTTRRTSNSSVARRSSASSARTSTAKSASKSKTSTSKVKTSKPAKASKTPKTKASGAKSGTLSVRRERH